MTDQEHARTVITVHECYDDGEAEIIIALLRSHGIEAMANSEVPHSVLPLTADGLGKVRVLVDEEVAEKARGIIAESGGTSEEDPAE